MNRDIRFGLLLSPAERLALGRLAEAEGGLSQAATLRRLIRQAALARDSWPVEDAKGTTKNGGPK